MSNKSIEEGKGISIILSFIDEFYDEKENKTLFDEKKNFPKEATIYNRNEENTNN